MSTRVAQARRAYDQAVDAHNALTAIIRSNATAGRGQEMRALRARVTIGHAAVDAHFAAMTPDERAEFGPPIDPHHRQARGFGQHEQ